MSFTLQPVRVATGFDEEGMLVLDAGQRLVAVLVHLSDDNEVAPGQWYLEAGFGRIGWNKPPDLRHSGHRPGLDQPMPSQGGARQPPSSGPVRPAWPFHKGSYRNYADVLRGQL